jgi:hypothetical protein
MKRAETVLGFLLLVLFSVLFYETLDYKWQVALAPRLAAGAGVVLAVWHLAGTLLSPSRETGGESPYDLDDLFPIAGFLAAVALVTLFGFVYGGTAFVFFSVLVTASWNWKLAIICAAPIPVFFHYGFHVLLKIPVFDGLMRIQGLT